MQSEKLPKLHKPIRKCKNFKYTVIYAKTPFELPSFHETSSVVRADTVSDFCEYSTRMSKSVIKLI